MTNKCSDCLHNEVCKFKDKYLKGVKNFQEWQGIKSLYEYPIKIEISCCQFVVKPQQQFVKENIENLCISTPTNSCEGCPIYEYIKTGKSVVNDACSFCSKSPTKVGD